MVTITTKSAGNVITSADYNALVNKVQNGTDTDVRIASTQSSGSNLTVTSSSTTGNPVYIVHTGSGYATVGIDSSGSTTRLLNLTGNTTAAPLLIANQAAVPSGGGVTGDIAVVNGVLYLYSLTGWGPVGAYNKIYSFSSAMVYGDSSMNTTGLVRSWNFAGAGFTYAYCSMCPPSTYSGGNITVKVVWTPGAAPTGGQVVKWFLEYYSLANGADIGTSPVLSISAVHTFTTETIDDVITTTVGTITLPNANCYFRIKRDGGDAADTWAATARFHQLNLEFP